MAHLSKENAARAALEYVKDGMILGLGSGSTSEIFLEMLGLKVADGLKVRGIPSSEQTAEVARKAGIPLIDIDQADVVHLTVDGADEVAPDFTLIKGGGGRLLREKIIANASDLMVVIVDDTKMVETLGAFPLPVEVDPFGYTITAKKVFDQLTRGGCTQADIRVRMQKDGQSPFITDGGNYILDCMCGIIPRPHQIAKRLCAIPGVVEHGLFVELARVVIVGDEQGVDILEN